MLDLETGLVLGNLEVNQSLSILKDLIQSLMNIVSDKLTQLKLKLASLGWGVGPNEEHSGNIKKVYDYHMFIMK